MIGYNGTFAMCNSQTKVNCNRRTALERSTGTINDGGEEWGGKRVFQANLVVIQLKITNIRLVCLGLSTSSVKHHSKIKYIKVMESIKHK